MFSSVRLVFRSPGLFSFLATCPAESFYFSVQEVVDILRSVPPLLPVLSASGARYLQAGIAHARTTSELCRLFPPSAACTECGILPVSRRYPRISPEF